MMRFLLIIIAFLWMFPGLTWGTTYYVSPTGDDSNGDGSESNPWRTISHAVSNASNGDIIKVMDDDNDATDDYVENVVVDKQLTIEAYDDDGTKPTVKSAAPTTSNPVFKITANNVVIRKLRMYISDDPSGGSAVWIADGTGCEIDAIETGWASDKRCYYGIFVGSNGGNTSQTYIHDCVLSYTKSLGIYLGWYSGSHRVINNTIEHSGAQGIRMFTSDNNLIDNNTIRYSATNGIEITSSVTSDYYNFNAIIGNTIENAGNHGIYVEYGAQYTMIAGNTITNCSNNAGIRMKDDITGTIVAKNYISGCKYGIDVNNCTGGKIYTYLNTITNNTESNLNGAYEQYYSPTKLSYLFKSFTTMKYLMGNRYGDMNDGHEDKIMTGVAPEYYYNNYTYARYPLIQDQDEYTLMVWNFSNPQLHRADFTRESKKVTLTGGANVVWADAQPSEADVTFPAGSQDDNTSWTGFLSFYQAPASGHTFTITIGYADDSNGTNFTSSGATATITGDGSAHEFAFTTSASSFTIPAGKYLAVQITNNSSSDYDLLVGGAWSFISPPASSPRYPRVAPPNRTPIYISPNGSDYTGMGTEAAPLRSFRAAMSIIQNGQTISVMDDDNSSTTDYKEHVTVTKSITIQAYDTDGTMPQMKVYDSVDSAGFHIKANNVTIQGMDITYGNWGIYLTSVSNCQILNNNASYHEFVGIELANCSQITISGNTCNSNDFRGIYLYYSSNNTISNNTCNDNDAQGILIYHQGNNVLSGNVCNNNSRGIEIYYCDSNTITGGSVQGNENGIWLEKANYNTISGTTIQSSSWDGIYILMSSWNVVRNCTIQNNAKRGILLQGHPDTPTKYNFICNSTIDNAPHGIYINNDTDKNTIFNNTIKNCSIAGIYNYSSICRVYFNDFIGNSKPIDNDGSLNAVSSRKIGYFYSLNYTLKEYLGNYYSDYTGNDTNGDGIGDDTYAGDGFNDAYPLKKTRSNYSLQSWFLHSNQKMERNTSEGYGTVTINNGSSVVFVDPQAAQTNIVFGAGSVSQTTSWTGHFWLTTNNEYDFTIQMGYADADGSNFYAAGGIDNASGINDNFYIITSAVQFTVPKGKHLAVRITNNLSGSKASKDLVVGAGYSYISAPIQSEDYSLPITLTSFTATAQPEGVLLEWTTGSEINNAGFHLYRATSKEGPFTCITPHLIPGAGNSTISHSYSFLDKQVVDGQTYWYKLQDIAFDGSGTFHPAISITYHPSNLENTEIPKRFYLNPAFPNPFNNSTKITYGVPEPAKISLKVYDVRGRLVRTLVAGEKAAGHYHTYWNGRNDLGEAVASGVYFLRLEAPYYQHTRQILLLK